MIDEQMTVPRLHAVLLALGAVLWLAVPCEAQQQLERPGAGLPTFDAPAAGDAPPRGAREKTDALMESVGLDQPGVLATRVVTRSATVEAIDHAARAVSLRGDDGVTMQRTVAPDVDLTQVKNGDRVSIKEIASVAVFISPRALAAPPAERTVVVETAEPGEKPARITVETEEIAATVAAIEHSTRSVTLRNPDGSTRTIQVDPRVELDEIDVGDQVTLRITKALALAVETPQ